jgi:hypothetical protein
MKLKYVLWIIGVISVLIWAKYGRFYGKSFRDFVALKLSYDTNNEALNSRYRTNKYHEGNVTKIEIQSSLYRIVIEKKKNNDWKMMEPFTWPVNPFSVQKFFQILRQNIDIPVGNIITFHRKGGSKQTIYSNHISPNTISKENEPIYSNTAFWCLQKICPMDPKKITHLNLTLHETYQNFFFSKKESTWHFEKPIRVMANTNSLQNFLEWVTHLEVLPLGETEFRTQFESQNTITYPDNFRKPYLTMTLIDEHQKSFRMTWGYSKDKISSEVHYYAWLDNHPALFQIPWNELLDHPLQSLCNQSVFPKIQSISVANKSQKLFLVCDESGKWNALKFSESPQSFQSLNDFDIKSLLFLFSLAKPVNVIDSSVISPETSEANLCLEINGTVKFELLRIGDTAYVLSGDKHYAIIIDLNLFQKLFESIQEILEM